jgi:hypothetical protein
VYPQPLIQIEIARRRPCELRADGAQRAPVPRTRRRGSSALRVALMMFR